MAPRPPPEVALNLALALVASSTAPVLLLDNDLAVVAASASFCSAFQIDQARTSGSAFTELGAGEWNVPQLAGLLKATASGFAEVENYEMDLKRNGRTTRRLVANAKRLHYADEGDIRLILSIADVTDARIAEKLKEDLLRERDVLLQELNHRVANSLQIIASVLMQSARRVQSEETRGHLYDAHQRVMSVAALQQQLAGSKLGDVEVRPYLVALCDSIGASMIQDRDQLSLELTADDSITAADTSISLGLIVTELVINALKHAFPDNRGGRILVDYRSRGPDWTMSVSDDGIGMPEDGANAKPGLGTSIVQALAKQLGAEIKVAKAHPGTKVSIAHASVPVLVAQIAV
jgi:two-component system, sensor histidine kinase PdtaS